MTGKNYRKGRRKEYAIRTKLLAEGYEIAQRSAGSFSPIDIFAINKDKRIIKFIQAKPDNLPKWKLRRILKELVWLNGTWEVEFEVR